MFIHDLVIYRSDIVDSFIATFEADPLNIDIVRQFINSYHPIKTSPFTGKALHIDLTELVAYQGRLIVLHKLANGVSLSNLSADELQSIFSNKTFPDKELDPLLSPMIKKKNHRAINSILPPISIACIQNHSLMDIFYLIYCNYTLIRLLPLLNII